MPFDPEMLKKLLEIFQAELEETCTTLINGLVQLEKNTQTPEERLADIESVFRAAHNLKGAARGLGIETIGEIAHHIESIFAVIKTDNIAVAKNVIDVCLDAVDKMQLAMQAFSNKTELKFDLPALIANMAACIKDKPQATQITPPVASAPSININVPTTVDSIRVPLKVIDRLSELSEEIQSSKIEMDDHAGHAKLIAHQFQNFAAAWHVMSGLMQEMMISANDHRLQKSLSRANDDMLLMATSIQKMSQDLLSQSTDYSRLAKSVQDEVTLLRLVPANNYLNILPRYIRELSTELHKKAELEIKGGEVYIDKYVLESLKDPINHLLRNAIDHGIESAEARIKAGKAPEGNITLTVRDAGQRVIFEISDDGSGLDYKHIKDKIARLHPELANKMETLTNAQLEDFIFHPGFSTRNEVTSISGRGVGLDVVRRNVQLLKGSVHVENHPGSGLTFVISVPLSISSERGLLVQCDDQTYVLPTSSVTRVVLLKQNDIVNVEGGHAALIGGHPILLKSLTTVLGGNASLQTHENFPIVILESRDTRIALVVDQVLGEREIVIKPILEPLAAIDCVSGATLLDRNKIALVLDPDQLLSLSYLTHARYMLPAAMADMPALARHILVVDDSITTRTLEKNILESKKFQVTTAVNGQDAWDILQKQSFALVVTDVNMPIMDGFELTEKIKRSENLSTLPVIIVTSLGSDAEKSKGVDVGADAYIVKSEFESETLLQMINRLI